MFFKTSDDVKIAYSINGKGKPIILITGFGGYQEIWTAQKQYLLQMGYQVITYDHRNMGKSERTAKGQTLSRLTQDLIELLNFLQISQAVFVGHSMGGSVIYNLLKVKPEIIKFAIIIDQSPYMLNTSNWHYGFMNYTKDNFKQETLKVPNVKETLNGVAPQIAVEVAKAKVDYPFNRQNNIKLLQEHSSIDWRPVVMNTRIPINVVAAKESPYYDCNFAEWMKKENNQITATVLDNVGHDIMSEAPIQFNQLLRHYLMAARYLA